MVLKTSSGKKTSSGCTVLSDIRATNLVIILEHQCLELTARQYFISHTTVGQMDNSLEKNKA